MRKSSFLLLPLLILLAASAFADGKGFYAVKSAVLENGELVIETSDGWTVKTDVRNVGVEVGLGLSGTYVHLPSLPPERMKGDNINLDEISIYVRTDSLARDWLTTIRTYLKERESPSDVVPTIVDSQ